MKKLLVAAVALTLSASAFADWEVVEQNDNSITFAEKSAGVAMNVTAAGKSGAAPIKDVAEAAAKDLGCGDVSESTIGKYPAYHLASCPDDVQVFVVDDGKDIVAISGKCSSAEACATVDTLLDKIVNE